MLLSTDLVYTGLSLVSDCVPMDRKLQGADIVSDCVPMDRKLQSADTLIVAQVVKQQAKECMQHLLWACSYRYAEFNVHVHYTCISCQWPVECWSGLTFAMPQKLCKVQEQHTLMTK